MIEIVQGDCLSVMRAMPSDSVDSIVTDPPYGLSDHKPAEVLECLKAWIAGEPHTPKGKGFMGKEWDAWVPGPEIWRECLRVVKPGGHLLAFAGTRSMDLMSMAVRLAGFELRDSIGYANDGGGAPLLAWSFGSGFPKSLDVSKAIDKAAGVDREVIQQGERSAARPVVDGQSGNKAYRLSGDASITAPATEAAKQWQGWGTALKPAWEPIILARKPMVGTVAANVLEHGTGALNIDGCRVEGRERTDYGLANCTRSTGNTCGKPSGPAEFDASKGRWPANLITDGSDEVVAGFPDSSGSGGARALKRGQRDGDGWGMADRPGELRDAGTGSAARFFQQCKGGYDSVWQDLNLPPESASTAEQSSSQQRQAAVSALALAVNSVLPEGLHCSGLSLGPSTSATGSELKLIADSVTQTIQTIGQRFWLGSRPARLSLSLNHASVAVSLEQTGTMTITASHWRSDGFAEDVTFNITPTSLEAGARGCGQSTAGKRLIYCAKASRNDRGEGNTHPTVKPTDLMRYLCRLVTPPGGVVLDPFMGSGSTGKAALREGFQFIGIERDSGYFEIAKALLTPEALETPHLILHSRIF